MNERNDLCFIYDNGSLEALYGTMKPGDFFVEEAGGLPADSTYHVTVVRGKE